MEKHMAIDEVSRIVGNFETMFKTHAADIAVIKEGIKEIRDYQIQQNGKVTALHGRVDTIEEEAVTKYSVMKAAILIGGTGGLGATGILAVAKTILGLGS